MVRSVVALAALGILTIYATIYVMAIHPALGPTIAGRNVSGLLANGDKVALEAVSEFGDHEAARIIFSPIVWIDRRLRSSHWTYTETNHFELVRCACGDANNSQAALSDAGIVEKIVGTWNVSELTPGGVSASGTVSILRDGSFSSKGRFVRGEREISIAYTGTWQVEKGALIETIKTTSNSNLLAVGFVTRDKILRLDGRELVFETEAGKKVTRERAR